VKETAAEGGGHNAEQFQGTRGAQPEAMGQSPADSHLNLCDESVKGKGKKEMAEVDEEGE